MLAGKRQKNGLKVISVTSGKGGVGKTLTTVNLATAAAQLDRKVMILDGDMGLANVDVVLGLTARYNIGDVMDGQVSMNDIVLQGPMGIKIIPSGSGITKLTQMSYLQRMQLFDHTQALDADFDTMIIDTGAGIADSVLHLNALADDFIVVTTPEPHALTDAYAMIKVMYENYQRTDPKLVINMVQSRIEAEKIHERIAQVAKRFLGVDVEFLGHVPKDPQVQKFVALRQAASAKSSHTLAGQAWNQITQRLFNNASIAKRRNEDHVWRELIWAQQEQNALKI